MPAERFDPEAIFAAFHRADAAYVTVGGFAVVAHGVVRATVDVDLVPDPHPGNRERVAAALRSLGARPAGEPSTSVDPTLLARDANMRFDTEAGQVDLLCAEPYRELYADLRSRALEIDVDGVLVIVASRNDLIRLKAATGRERDLLDIGDLLALDETEGT